MASAQVPSVPNRGEALSAPRYRVVRGLTLIGLAIGAFLALLGAPASAAAEKLSPGWSGTYASTNTYQNAYAEYSESFSLQLDGTTDQQGNNGAEMTYALNGTFEIVPGTDGCSGDPSNPEPCCPAGEHERVVIPAPGTPGTAYGYLDFEVNAASGGELEEGSPEYRFIFADAPQYVAQFFYLDCFPPENEVTEAGLFGIQGEEQNGADSACGRSRPVPADFATLVGSDSCDAHAPGSGHENVNWRITRRPDRDHDGFPDATDKCPDTYALPTSANGCPHTEQEEKEVKEKEEKEREEEEKERTTTKPVYVALGDSYSSGEGTYGYEDGTAVRFGDECHRSEHAYGALVSKKLPSNWGFRFGACSGAVASDIYETNHFEESPQTGALTICEPAFSILCSDWGNGKGNAKWVTEPAGVEEVVKLVTIGVGGNDEGFKDTITECVEVHAEYLALKAKLWPFHAPHISCNPKPSLPDDRLTVRLNLVYQDIHKAAPQATLIVMGYPQIFSSHAPDGGVNCDINGWDARKISGLEKHVNTVIKAAVHKAGPWAHYIDNDKTFNGHELCRKTQSVRPNEPSYLNGLLLNGLEPVHESFHPDAEGHEALAAKLWGEKSLQNAIK